MEKKIKEEVKKEVKREENKESKGSGKKGKKNLKKYIKKEVKKEEKKQGNQGPKPKFSVRVTATIGYVDGNKDHGPNLKIATFLHPSLCKGPDEDRAFGPLQAAAAQYGLWRLSKVTIRMTPLVGSSAVSGTVVRLSSNLTQTPGSTSWGGLGARKHRDFQAGRSGTFILTRQDVAGPRAGGWWQTDTNVEGAQSAGPVIEAHCLGKTSSTYQDRPWEGQLFIVELSGRWEFANYNMNPALGSLERHESEVSNAKITTNADGEMQLEIPAQSAAALFMNDPTTPRAGQNDTPGEIVYQIVDTAAGLAGSALPPPFNWLIKGGWWFLKRVIGRTRNANETFKIYASLADAQNNKPAISTQKSHSGNPVTTTIQVTQMNAPNMGGASVIRSVTTSGGSFPIQPMGQPPSAFQLNAVLQLVYNFGEGQNLPVFLTGASVRTLTNNRQYPAIHYRALQLYLPVFRQGQLESFSDPNNFNAYYEMRLEATATGTQGQMAIFVAGHASWLLGSGAGGNWWLHALLWTAKSATERFVNLTNQANRVIVSKLLDKKFRYEAPQSSTATPSESSISGSWFVTFIAANTQTLPALTQTNVLTLSSSSFELNATGEPSSAMGIITQTSSRGSACPVAFEMNTIARRESKLEKLARKLGVDLDELSDSESDCLTDVDIDESSDSSCDEEDDCQQAEEDTASDFENVTQTELQNTYERLRAAGFSHVEADRMSKV